VPIGSASFCHDSDAASVAGIETSSKALTEGSSEDLQPAPVDGKANPMLTGQPNVESVWTTLEGDAERIYTVVVVETYLTLDPQHPNYDGAQVTRLLDAIAAHLAANPHLDRMRVVQKEAAPRS
jgi:hypothetical protein